MAGCADGAGEAEGADSGLGATGAVGGVDGFGCCGGVLDWLTSSISKIRLALAGILGRRPASP